MVQDFSHQQYYSRYFCTYMVHISHISTVFVTASETSMIFLKKTPRFFCGMGNHSIHCHIYQAMDGLRGGGSSSNKFSGVFKCQFQGGVFVFFGVTPPDVSKIWASINFPSKHKSNMVASINWARSVFLLLIQTKQNVKLQGPDKVEVCWTYIHRSSEW